MDTSFLEQDLELINDYVDTYLYGDKPADARAIKEHPWISYQRWAADQIAGRLVHYIMFFRNISDYADEPMTGIDVAEEFLAEMEWCSEEATKSEPLEVFLVALEEADSIIFYLRDIHGLDDTWENQW